MVLAAPVALFGRLSWRPVTSTGGGQDVAIAGGDERSFNDYCADFPGKPCYCRAQGRAHAPGNLPRAVRVARRGSNFSASGSPADGSRRGNWCATRLLIAAMGA